MANTLYGSATYTGVGTHCYVRPPSAAPTTALQPGQTPGMTLTFTPGTLQEVGYKTHLYGTLRPDHVSCDMANLAGYPFLFDWRHGGWHSIGQDNGDLVVFGRLVPDWQDVLARHLGVDDGPRATPLERPVYHLNDLLETESVKALMRENENLIARIEELERDLAKARSELEDLRPSKAASSAGEDLARALRF